MSSVFFPGDSAAREATPPKVLLLAVSSGLIGALTLSTPPRPYGWARRGGFAEWRCKEPWGVWYMAVNIMRLVADAARLFRRNLP